MGMPVPVRATPAVWTALITKAAARPRRRESAGMDGLGEVVAQAGGVDPLGNEQPMYPPSGGTWAVGRSPDTEGAEVLWALVDAWSGAFGAGSGHGLA